VTTVTDYSRVRQELSRLRVEQEKLLESMMRPGKMVRGSITWHKKIEPEDTGKLYPGLVRTVDGKRIGRRVRVGHLGWLEPMMERYREYRKRMKRLRAVQREIMELLERLRHEELYDYEATAEGYLVRIGLEEEYGKA
jgi:hypothetical protein